MSRWRPNRRKVAGTWSAVPDTRRRALIPRSPSPEPSPCRTCGACCAFSRDWPRFTTESEAALAQIPWRFVDRSGAGMQCTGDRCSALVGDVGVSTSCAVYADRPDVCRACEAGDEACGIARASYRLPALAAG